MSNDKTGHCPAAAVPNGCRVQMLREQSLREQSREDLRLDCLRLALQRQGARDSRELLVIAEEYYDWVIAESGGTEAHEAEALPSPLEWHGRKEASSARARLTLGTKKATVEPKPKARSRPTRSKAGS